MTRSSHHAVGAASGAVLIALGILCLVIQIYVSGIRDRDQNRDLTGDPWGGRTLEWATSSPPPFYNFAVVPHVHERDAFWGNERKGEAYKKPDHYEEIHMPKNSGAGIVIAAFSTIFGFAMIWHIWWLAIVGFARHDHHLDREKLRRGRGLLRAGGRNRKTEASISMRLLRQG